MLKIFPVVVAFPAGIPELKALVLCVWSYPFFSACCLLLESSRCKEHQDIFDSCLHILASTQRAEIDNIDQPALAISKIRAIR